MTVAVAAVAMAAVAMAVALMPTVARVLLLARRAETGATLLIITHDAALAQRCERVLTMADGVIVSDTAPQALADA